MNYPNKAKGQWCAFIVFTIWGFTLLASSVAQESAEPIVFIMWRFVLSAFLMIVPFLTGRKKLVLNRKKLLCILALGLCEPVIYFPCEQYALMNTNSSFLGIMLAMIPVVTMIMGAAILNEKTSAKQWIFSGVSIVGVIALTLITSYGGDELTLQGVILSVICVLTGGLYGIISKKISPYTDPYERCFGCCVMGAVFFAVWAAARHLTDPSEIFEPLCVPSFDMAVIYVSVFGSVIGYDLLNKAYDYAPTANVVVFCNLQTVLAVLCGVIFLEDPVSWKAFIAMAVVLIGIWGVQHNEPE